MNRLNNQIFDSLNAGLVYLDKDFKLVEYNKLGLSALGADENLDLTGTSIFEISDIYKIDFQDIFQSVLEKQQYKNIWSYPVKPAGKDTSCFWDYTVSSFEDGLLLTAFDASERVEHDCKRIQEKEKRLIELQAKVNEYSRLKTDFIANISHELRTPLTSIIGFAQILKNALDKGQTPVPNVQEGLQKILKNARHLLEMVEDVLTLSKLESGFLRFNYEKFKLPSLVKEIISTLQPAAEAKGLNINLNVADEKFPLVNSDARWVYHIIRDLLSNAVKFTGSGSITVNLKSVDDFEWLLSVSDTGIGIDKKNFAKIFENFHQADMSITRQGGGFGIGLSLGRLLAEKLGGTISLVSEMGAGSTFTLRMPFNSPLISVNELELKH